MIRRIAAWIIPGLEVLFLVLLVLTARCANYQDVFVGGETFFTDGDCYARMTRVRLCAAHPGLILRHHRFENFPEGTSPHTTAPLDYLILGLSILLRPFTAQPIEQAGAWISPLIAVAGSLFLWWWSSRRKLRYRWAMLALFALSPLLVHGSQLGRPDHEALTLVLVVVAICSELTLQTEPPRRWSLLNGAAWGLAIWVSAYEPLILLLLVLLLGSLLPFDRRINADREIRALSIFTGRHRRPGWIVFIAVLVVAFLIERRLPGLVSRGSREIFRSWARTIGELRSVSLWNPIWFRWAGWLLPAAPFLIWLGLRTRTNRVPRIMSVSLLLVTFGLTMWQVRWGYFFVALFAIALPDLLAVLRPGWIVWIALLISSLPILRDWEETLWPNESEIARRIEQRHEAIEIRELSLNMMSSQAEPFLAPWWLSPEIAYWSGQPGVAGTSHESLPGIADSARFFLSEDLAVARDILNRHKVSWVVAYDASRVEENSAALLAHPSSNRSFVRLLEEHPPQVARFLRFSAQNGTGKLFLFEK